MNAFFGYKYTSVCSCDSSHLQGDQMQHEHEVRDVQRGPKPLKKLEGRPICSLHTTKSQNFLAVHRDRNEIRMRSRSSNAMIVCIGYGLGI